jgi:hypothetical protein
MKLTPQMAGMEPFSVLETGDGRVQPQTRFSQITSAVWGSYQFTWHRS